MAVHFGKRVAGEKAHAEAVAASKGGAEVFGKRVRGAISSDSIANQEKRQSEFGPRTTSKASISDTTGKGGTVSVDDLKILLDEATGNIPAFFDSLYEQELALSGGPRKDALEVFATAEMGIKGQGRRVILDEINALLGKTAVEAERQAQAIADSQERYAAQAERTEENKLLRDAPRLKALAEREENLKAVRSGSSKSTKDQVEKDLTFGVTTVPATGNVLGDKSKSETKAGGEGSSSPQDKPQTSAGKPSGRKASSTKKDK